MSLPDAWPALASYAKSLPRDATVPVPASLIVAVAAELGAGGTELSAELSIADLARRFGKASSTCRAWCEAGLFPGATKWRRNWRIPRGDVEAFEAGGREAPTFTGKSVAPRRKGKGDNLDAWRNGGHAA